MCKSLHCSGSTLLKTTGKKLKIWFVSKPLDSALNVANCNYRFRKQFLTLHTVINMPTITHDGNLGFVQLISKCIEIVS